MTTATTTTLPTGTWAVDVVHSTLGFAVKHLGITTYRGNFPGVEGTITTADGRFTGIEGSAKIDSLTTNDPNLTGHLLTPDFFDAATYPTGSFVATSTTLGEDNAVTIQGELTLRGVSKPVTLTGELEGVGPDPYGNTRLGLALKGEINRTDFGINWNTKLDNGALAVAEKVKLEWDVQAILQGAS